MTLFTHLDWGLFYTSHMGELMSENVQPSLQDCRVKSKNLCRVMLVRTNKVIAEQLFCLITSRPERIIQNYLFHFFLIALVAILQLL